MCLESDSSQDGKRILRDQSEFTCCLPLQQELWWIFHPHEQGTVLQCCFSQVPRNHRCDSKTKSSDYAWFPSKAACSLSVPSIVLHRLIPQDWNQIHTANTSVLEFRSFDYWKHFTCRDCPLCAETKSAQIHQGKKLWRGKMFLDVSLNWSLHVSDLWKCALSLHWHSMLWLQENCHFNFENWCRINGEQ